MFPCNAPNEYPTVMHNDSTLPSGKVCAHLKKNFVKLDQGSYQAQQIPLMTNKPNSIHVSIGCNDVFSGYLIVRE